VLNASQRAVGAPAHDYVEQTLAKTACRRLGFDPEGREIYGVEGLGWMIFGREVPTADKSAAGRPPRHQGWLDQLCPPRDPGKGLTLAEKHYTLC